MNRLKVRSRKKPKAPWNKWGHNNPKSMEHSESSPKREIHSMTGLPQETRKISNKLSNFTLKGVWKRTINKDQGSRRVEIITIREEINEIDSKKYKKSMKSTAGSLKR